MSKSNAIRVLVVEDHKTAAIAARLVLEMSDCVVDVVRTSEEALIQIQKVTVYDLIFVDIGLAKMDGIELTKKIRGLNDPKKSKTPIIALTAHVDDLKKQQCYEAGMNNVLSKPILLDTVKDILSQLDLENNSQDNDLSES